MSEDQLLATNYFKFLEANSFIKCDREYFYGDLLQSTPPGMEESMLILLQMFKVSFPAGLKLEVPKTHEPFTQKQRDARTNLIARVLSLFPMQSSSQLQIDTKNPDFSLALFSAYAQVLKSQL